MIRKLIAILVGSLCAIGASSAQAAARASRTPVAATELTRGATLTTTDIRWSDTTLADGSTPSASSVSAGWIAKRLIHVGEVLREPAVARPTLIANGNAVDVVYSAQGVSIRLRGTAIGSGSEGDEVYVRLDNRKRLRGTVAGPNTVRVM